MLHGEKAQYILLDMDYQYLLSSEQYTMWGKLDKKYQAENIFYPPVRMVEQAQYNIILSNSSSASNDSILAF